LLADLGYKVTAVDIDVMPPHRSHS